MNTLRAVLLAALLSPASNANGPLLIQAVTVNQTDIAFSCAGDLWIVSRAGGAARRLVQHSGVDTDPVFSPDGSQIAFSRRADGNVDVYVVAATGGTPRRLTHHPKTDTVVGWSRDGRSILFASNRASFNRAFRLYSVPAQGGAETVLPFPFAQGGSFSPDGRRIAYIPWFNYFGWRNYHGGWTSAIRIVRLDDGRVEEVVPHENANDDCPMWEGTRVYFVSDRDDTGNLWVYDLSTKALRQLTHYRKYDVAAASLGGDAIVFTQDGRVHLFDLATEQERTVAITVSADFPETKPKTVKAVDIVRSFDVSSGQNAAFEARGDILVMDLTTQRAKNLTRTPGAAERWPAWSPDGRTIAYFSDETGEYQLNLREASGERPARRIAIETHPSSYSEPVWSPDGKRIAFSDKRLALWCFDVAGQKPRTIDVSTFAQQGAYSPAWSPDGRWLAYSKNLANGLRAIFLHSIDANKSYQLTDGRQEADLPAFDRGGAYLYFLTSFNLAPTKTFGISLIPAAPLVKSRVQAVVLGANTRSPLHAGDVAAGTRTPRGERMRVDLAGIRDRIVTLPLPLRNYTGLAPGVPGVLWIYEQVGSEIMVPENVSQVLRRFDLSSAKTEHVIQDVDAFVVSRDGTRVLYQSGDTWKLRSGDGGAEADEHGVDMDALEVRVEPRAEWRQMFDEAWRIERDWFYDPNFHGQKLDSLRAHYDAYLPNVGTREDLNRLFKEMLAHLSISHMAIGGGDQPREFSPGVGLLGADFAVDRGRYRIERIYRGDPSDPLNPDVTSPLGQPGLGIAEGDALLAVDGREVSPVVDVYQYFAGKAGKAVQLKLQSKSGRSIRTVTVEPLSDETTLRRLTWAADNRRAVDRLSNGRLAYVYLADHERVGYTTFLQDFFAQRDRQGIIVDQRFSPGGYSPDALIDALKRVPLSAYTFRSGHDVWFPLNTLPGPRVLIANEFNGSGTESFAAMWRRANVGPIVGERTTGGGIGPYVDIPRLMDGGFVSAPNRAFFDPFERVWRIENHGVTPDVEVDWSPAAWRAHRDPQLERAVEVAMKSLRANRPPALIPPQAPVYP